MHKKINNIQVLITHVGWKFLNYGFLKEIGNDGLFYVKQKNFIRISF